MEHINIIGTLFDNSIDHVVAHASQVHDDRLEKDQQTINSELYGLVNEALGIQQEEDDTPVDITKLQEDVEDIKSAINNINEELGNREYTYLIFLTEAQYNALTEYEEDAVYFVMKSDWTFGDGFPIVLGGGWQFPITLT